MKKKFIVRLTVEERRQLLELITKGESSALRIRHAGVLLKADCSIGPSWADAAISQAFCCSLATVANIRQRFVEEGMESALSRKQQSYPSRHSIIDGEKEARLIAISCSSPPDGRSFWTLRLLANRMVELSIVESISSETVRKVLKKTNLNHICANAG